MSLYIQATNKLNAFSEYLNQTDFYNDIPEYLHSWVDLQSALDDFQNKGLNIEMVTTDIYYFHYN